MSCNTSNPYLVTYPTPCDCCQDGDCTTTYDAKCVRYNGPALPCSGINTGDNLETALEALEEQICAATGDFSTYNFYCLAPIYTQQQFVETISEGYCNLLDDFDTFVNVTFVNYQTFVANQFTAITNPGLTCTYASVTNTDTLNTILTKYCNTFGAIFDDIDISGVDWTGGGCFVVPVTPVTIAEGFQMVLDRLCACGCSGGSSLPYFNNLGSCLSGGTANDSLTTTINLIKTRLCQTGTFDINALDWGCLTKPSTTTTDLQGAFQTVLDTLTEYKQGKLTFSADFVVTATDPMDPCQGLTVELATPIVGNDRLVASNVADLSPGTLIQKLTPGTNITLDDATIPGQVIINSTSGYTVKADAADTSADYLINKVEGVNNTVDGVAISESYNAVTDKVDLTPSIDWTIFITKLFNEIQTDPVLQDMFCAMVDYCGSTTTTTTTLGASDFVLVPGAGLYFTGILASGVGMPTFSYPVNAFTSLTYMGLTAQNFDVTINGTYPIPGDANVSLLVNGLVVDCATVTGGAPGTYQVTLPSAPLLGEEVRISIGIGGC